MTVAFNIVPGTGLYLSAGTAEARPFGFLATVAVGPTALLADLWLDSAGVFFSLSAPLKDAESAALLEVMLREWLVADGWPTAGQRMLWIDFVTENGAVTFEATTLAVQTGGGAGPVPVAHPVSLDFQGYRVEITAGAMLSAGPAGDTLRITGLSAFCAESSIPVAYPVGQSLVTVPVGGDNAGALVFAIDLTDRTDFFALGIGVRYGWRVGAIGVAYHHVPTITQPSAPIRLWAIIHPLAIDDPKASRLSFIAPAPAAETAPALVSSYLTPEGWAVTLTPTGNGPTRAGGLAFARQPLLATGDVQDDPCRHYLSLDGDYLPSVPAAAGAGTGAPIRILCGLGALEYVAAKAGAPLSFAIMPAFASPTGLSAAATTAWLAASAEAVDYFAQPDSAPFYAVGQDPYLGFLEMAAAILPAGQAWLPMIGHAGFDAASPPAETVTVEADIVGPARRAVVAALGTLPPPITTVAEALTPQGLAVGLDPTDAAHWAWLAIASLTATTTPEIAFVEVARAFQQAAQSPGVFMALANADTVMASASIGYCLTAAQLAYLRAHPPSCFVGYDFDALTPLVGVSFPDEAAFNAKIPQPPANPPTPPEIIAQRIDLLHRIAGVMAATVDDWQFRFGPRTWPPAPGGETSDGVAETRQSVMIVKLDTLLSIREWLDRPASWAWQAAATLPGESIAATVAILKDSIALAEQRYAANPKGSPYAHLLNAVIDDPAWVGMIVINCETPIEDLPGGLEAIAAGIKPELFYAHHLGFEPGLVAVTGGKLKFAAAKIFGAIDYRDEVELMLDATDPADFAFKARQLTVGFERSSVASFTGSVALFVNRLFGATARKYPTDQGNVLPLDGIMVRQIGDDGRAHIGYRFRSSGGNDYQLVGSALATVACDAVVLTQSTAPGSFGDVITEFQLSGGMRFVPAPEFDMFSYGPVIAPAPPAPPQVMGIAPETLETPFGTGVLIGTFGDDEAVERLHDPDPGPGGDPLPPAGRLAFDKLVVQMRFDPGGGKNAPSFSLVIDDVAFDPKASSPRPNGLAARFPAVPRRFVYAAAEGPTPAGRGYIGADCGVRQHAIVAPWYGLEYELGLGTLGAIGGGAPITIRIVAAWSVAPDGGDAPLFFGVMLPGASAGSFGIDLQGVIKLGFAGIQFITYPAKAANPADPDGLGYAMRLRDFGLHILGKQFPSGHIDVMLAGDPASARPASIGWYAGYQSADTPAAKGGNRRRALAVRRAAARG